MDLANPEHNYPAEYLRFYERLEAQGERVPSQLTVLASAARCGVTLETAARLANLAYSINEHVPVIKGKMLPNLVQNVQQLEELVIRPGQGRFAGEGLPDGWVPVVQVQEGSSASGYCGCAFVHVARRVLVVAHRGTNSAEKRTFLSDASLFLYGYDEGIQSDAALFSQLCRSIRLEGNAAPLEWAAEVEVGHSLGGFLAVVAAHSPTVPEHTLAIAFDAPGPKRALERLAPGPAERRTPQFVNVVTSPDFVNVCGQQVPSSVIRLPVSLRSASAGTPPEEVNGGNLVVGSIMALLHARQGDWFQALWELNNAGVFKWIFARVISTARQQLHFHGIQNIIAELAEGKGYPPLLVPMRSWPATMPGDFRGVLMQLQNILQSALEVGSLDQTRNPLVFDVAFERSFAERSDYDREALYFLLAARSVGDNQEADRPEFFRQAHIFTAEILNEASRELQRLWNIQVDEHTFTDIQRLHERVRMLRREGQREEQQRVSQHLWKQFQRLLVTPGEQSQAAVRQLLSCHRPEMCAAIISAIHDGTTLQHVAAGQPDEAMLRILLDPELVNLDEVDVNVRDKEQNTPLHAAAAAGAGAACVLLLENGAAPNLQNEQGNTPLHIAMHNGNDVCCVTLLEGGADPNYRNIEMLSPMHIAASQTPLGRGPNAWKWSCLRTLLGSSGAKLSHLFPYGNQTLSILRADTNCFNEVFGFLLDDFVASFASKLQQQYQNNGGEIPVQRAEAQAAPAGANGIEPETLSRIFKTISLEDKVADFSQYLASLNKQVLRAAVNSSAPGSGQTIASILVEQGKPDLLSELHRSRAARGIGNDELRDLIDRKCPHFEGRTVLMECAKTDESPFLHELLRDFEANPNVKDADGCTALYYAIYHECPSNVMRLIEYNADASVRTNNSIYVLRGATRDTNASYARRIDMLLRALYAKYKPSADQIRQCEPPIPSTATACLDGLRNNDNLDTASLIAEAVRRARDGVQAELANAADLNAKRAIVKSVCKRAQTDETCVKALYALRVLFGDEFRTIINPPDSDDGTPLHWVAENAYEGSCCFLLAEGAKPNALHNDMTPLYIAADKFNNSDLLRVLPQFLRHGAEPFEPIPGRIHPKEKSILQSWWGTNRSFACRLEAFLIWWAKVVDA